MVDPTMASRTRTIDLKMNGADDDDVSSAAGNMSQHKEDDEVPSQSEDEILAIATNENKAVFRIKMVVLMVLLGSATVVAVSVYKYLTQTEDAVFRASFEDDGHKLLEGIGSALAKTLGQCDNLAVTLVSMAKLTNQTWPFVTMPDFAVRMSKFVPLTSAININLMHLVTPAQRKAWEKYSKENDGWVDEAMTIQEDWQGYYGPIIYNGTYNEVIHTDWGNVEENVTRTMLPIWQNFPVIPNASWTYNIDWMTLSIWESYAVSVKEHKAVVSEPYMIPKPGDAHALAESDIWAEFYSMYIPPGEEAKEPMSDILYPVITDIDRVYVAGDDNYDPANHTMVVMMAASMYWRNMLRNILPTGSNGIHIVFDNPCTDPFTYLMDGPKETYLGVGDHHDKKYDHLGIHGTLHDISAFARRNSVYSGAKLAEDHCTFTLHVYPSDEMKAIFTTHNPVIFTVMGLLIFAFTSLVFFLYDVTVERRQRTVLMSAARTSAIVSSLFPSAVRDRLYPVTEEANPKRKMEAFFPGTTKNRREGKNEPDASQTSGAFSGNPIAELYPETTVLFADIAGFTAWSSTRQPAQVFHLLETLYAAFDDAARQRGIFKVETIGDCYVAVVGLPTPRKNHAVVMARFAAHCRTKTQELTAELEKTLGPGTADLAIRIGLNSGPTTAGVLRGEKSRFQLFGDTVNTASRMESNGERYKIHVSQKTADLIADAGKGHWLTLREEQVNCKGKGMMTTYWCEPNAESSIPSEATPRHTVSSDSESVPHSLSKRLVDWNVDLFAGLLRETVKSRMIHKSKSRDLMSVSKEASKLFVGKPIDEVSEVLSFQKSSSRRCRVSGEPVIPESASNQLRKYITLISEMYEANPFHNFEHCSHVVMSAKKLLDRIMDCRSESCETSANLNQRVCDMLSDPLVQFAIIFAALIHDVEHPGVSNQQLVHEHHSLAGIYHDKSIAEQNSIDVAWNLLMQEQFSDLCSCLFATEKDLHCFRQVVVNGVMATDLFDNGLKSIRELRWEKSFADQAAMDGNDDCNRRATIVIELIIQASDVSHTMQHFTVYKKWNTHLLEEMYGAFVSGRSKKNPLEGWYEGELWFYDNYIIPLAQKLRDCGVFGVSCDEFLDYAKDNRLEWELKGHTIVREASIALKADNAARRSSIQFEI